jgi:hypothetical protein
VNRNSSDSSSQTLVGPVPTWVGIVRDKVDTLRFGVVQIVVHDSKVVQIERTEKTRLDGIAGRAAGCCD